MSASIYHVLAVSKPPLLLGQWDDPGWRKISPLEINHFHPESSDHRPTTRVKMAYDAAHLYVLFDVDDRYVISRHQRPQGPVSQDSCVEFFLQVRSSPGYFNFEINAGGTMLLRYNRVPRVDFESLPPTSLEAVKVFHSLPRTVMPEMPGPVNWQIELAIPISILERYAGPITLPGSTMRANFYKCASESSHPHWASWSPIGPGLDFHVPSCFGELIFI